MNILKAIMLVAVVASALTFGACQHKEAAVTTQASTYSK